jgi:murein L,D-transpeptidase YafK
MLPRTFLLLAVVSVLALAPCPNADAASTRRVTRLLIKKSAHTMTLLDDDSIVASYKVAIGPGGSGFKRMQGDMTTPVGRYRVTAHQPSKYKVFLRLDYPNAVDRERFETLKRRGDLPPFASIGSDIGIHGPPVELDAMTRSRLKAHDWTAGCIAVDDEEISEIARLVKDGTPVDIED